MIGLRIAACIGIGHGGFAQHIEAVRKPHLAFRLRTVERFVDGATKHELPAQDLHRLKRCLAHNWLAQTVHCALQRRAHTALLRFREIEHFAG